MTEGSPGAAAGSQVRTDRLEADTGEPVITSKNAAQLNQVVMDMIEGTVEQANRDGEDLSKE